MLDVSFLYMLLLLPTKLGRYIGKKAVKGPSRIVYGTIYDQQKARTSLFQHRLPGTHCLSTQKGIGVATKDARFVVTCQHAQAYQERRTIHLALFS